MWVRRNTHLSWIMDAEIIVRHVVVAFLTYNLSLLWHLYTSVDDTRYCRKCFRYEGICSSFKICSCIIMVKKISFQIQWCSLLYVNSVSMFFLFSYKVCQSGYIKIVLNTRNAFLDLTSFWVDIYFFTKRCQPWKSLFGNS